MSKKLEGNGKYESSRMMLFEHRDELIERQQRMKRRVKPEIDDQKIQELNERICQAYSEELEISLVVFDAMDHKAVTGLITKVDVLGQRIQIGGQWLKMCNILEAGW